MVTATGEAVKFAGVLTAGAVLGWGLGFAGQNIVHNGEYWKRLPVAERLTYVDGYTDAMQVSVNRLESLNVAAELLHWKGAKKIIGQTGRDMICPVCSEGGLLHYVDEVYADPKYHDLEVPEAMQLAIARSDSSVYESLIDRPK